MDRLLGALVTRGVRRGLGGEPLWLAVGLAAWLVRRARRSEPPVVWSGRLAPGQSLVIGARGPDAGRRSSAAAG
ncbi:MAG TPA: hypothetical protein VMV14_06800 [Acidimicrobiales bacterium]|nr:hypothetical protein [Acidimicrobiales bacterium]